MSSSKQATLKTLIYADIFDYPLTKKELHRWLISSEPTTLPRLSSLLSTNNYYYLKNRHHLVALRKKREIFSNQKLIKAHATASLLKKIPTINFIGITGALAMSNSGAKDDIDFIIITKNHSLWITRFFTILLLEIFQIRRRPHGNTNNKICLNLFLEEASLVIPPGKQNLYTAHEVAQLKPLFDRNHTYSRFIKKNSWVNNFLPHALKRSICADKGLTR